MISKKEYMQTADFIFSREQTGGGFSFAGMMPPTLEDTYYAIRSLRLIEKGRDYKALISSKTIDYIKDIAIKETADYKYKYQADWLRRQYGLRPKTGVKKQKIIAEKRNVEQLYYQILLLGKNNILFPTGEKGFKNMRYIADIAYMVMIKMMLRVKFCRRRIVGRIKAIQNLDGGFGFVEGSTSFLENTYMAIAALDCLGERPFDIKRVSKFC